MSAGINTADNFMSTNFQNNSTANGAPQEARFSSKSPFLLENEAQYGQWREQKLQAYPLDSAQLRVNIENPYQLSQAEHQAIAGILIKTNLVIYKCTGETMNKSAVRSLGRQFGLERLDNNLCSDEDSITSLQVQTHGRQGIYIPYTNKPLSWHTDGYYNPADQQIGAILMHCVRPAAHGGINMYLDPEILYIQLRDQDPRWIAALMQPDAMTIPPNEEGGEKIRGETRGPVFSVTRGGCLHMRYSARTRNIEWAQNAHIVACTEFITDFLASDSPYIYRYRLAANEGVISNNVLHNRTAFENDAQHQRLLYRARYYDRVSVPTQHVSQDN